MRKLTPELLNKPLKDFFDAAAIDGARQSAPESAG